MSFQSKDGKNFGNAQKQKAYDRSKSSDSSDSGDSSEASGGPKKAIPGGEKVSTPGDQGGHGEAAASDGMGEQDLSDMPIHEVVAQHGPAQRIIIDVQSDGSHDVETHHAGKVHKAHLGSMDEADQHVRAATGTEAPMMDDKKPPMMTDMGQGGGIPGM